MPKLELLGADSMSAFTRLRFSIYKQFPIFWPVEITKAISLHMLWYNLYWCSKHQFYLCDGRKLCHTSRFHSRAAMHSNSAKGDSNMKGNIYDRLPPLHGDLLGAFHSTKISGNSGSKLNVTEIFRNFVSKISVHLSRLSFFLEIWKYKYQGRVEFWMHVLKPAYGTYNCHFITTRPSSFCRVIRIMCSTGNRTRSVRPGGDTVPFDLDTKISEIQTGIFGRMERAHYVVFLVSECVSPPRCIIGYQQI